MNDWIFKRNYLAVELKTEFLILFAAAAKSLQSCPTLCDPIDGSPPGSPVPGILQARIMEWFAMPSSRGPSQPRNKTQVSQVAGGFFTFWATREAQEYLGSLSFL